MTEWTTDELKDRLDLVEVVGRYVDLKKTGRSYMGLCPFHNDTEPSLSIDPEKGLWHCFGCGESGDVISFVMKIERLPFQEAYRKLAAESGAEWDTKGRGEEPHPENSPNDRTACTKGLTLAEYADAKRLPLGFLENVDLTDMFYMGKPSMRIPYLDANGEVRVVRFRLAMQGKSRFRWKKGSKPIPYGLWRLDLARDAGYIVLVEGESVTCPKY